MSKLVGFEELWLMATSAAEAHNGLVHHPCCDVWTTKASKAKRESHRQKLQWKSIMKALGSSCEDKKQALQAKMIEEGWRLPALLNESCNCQSRQTLRPEDPPKFHQSLHPPEELLLPFSPQDFIGPSPSQLPFQDPGINYPYQPTPNLLT